jgi:signal transduction histidine kinase
MERGHHAGVFPEPDWDPALAKSRELERATELLRVEMAERQRAEQARLQLLNRLVFAEEEERRRIAREMHDQCGQDLTALRLQVRRLKAECGENAALRGQVEALDAIVGHLDQDIDFLVWELRPTRLEGLDLRAALAKYLANWSTHYGIHVELHASEISEDRLTSKIKSTLYRIVQEALTNVAKHAEAMSCVVRLERLSETVRLTVEDNGKGFDVQQVMARHLRSGLGLLGVQERVSEFAGTFTIDSKPGHGTRLVVELPAEQVESASAVNGEPVREPASTGEVQ